MLGRSVSLEGSQEGIQQYLSGDLSVLANQPEVWMKAVSFVSVLFHDNTLLNPN